MEIDFGDSFVLKKMALKDSLSDVILHSGGNSSDIQATFRTDDVVDRTFRVSSWSPTEQLVKDRLPFEKISYERREVLAVIFFLFVL